MSSFAGESTNAATGTQRVGGIDCGTNTIRLLIADRAADGSLRDIERRMEMVRLGYGVDKSGRFDAAAIERTLAATREYAQLIREHGVTHVRFGATSATRDAENRDVFIRGVEEILGVSPEVISGDEEARLSYDGAVKTLPDSGVAPRLVVDIGGGSTELVRGGESVEAAISLNMGSVRLTERHLAEDPPTDEGIRHAIEDIDALLDEADQVVDFASIRSIIGVAGTVTTMSAVARGLTEYSPDATHGDVNSAADMVQLCEQIVRETREERSRHTVIHPGRIDVIGAGALIWARILQRVASHGHVSLVTTSEHDILDGLAMSARPRAADA